MFAEHDVVDIVSLGFPLQSLLLVFDILLLFPKRRGVKAVVATPSKTIPDDEEDVVDEGEME